MRASASQHCGVGVLRESVYECAWLQGSWDDDDVGGIPLKYERSVREMPNHQIGSSVLHCD